jgi:hypothetical protein
MARESMNFRVNRKTSNDVATVPSIRQETALANDLTWLSRNIGT